MKYTAINELSHFEYHDAEIKKIELNHGNINWHVSLLNATTENSQNDFDKDMCIEHAVIAFEQAHIAQIVFSAYKVYSNSGLIESVEAKIASPDEYSDIIRMTIDDFCYIFKMKELSMNQDKTFMACFHICSGVGDYHLTLSFAKSVIQWDRYCGIAWYEDEKWKRK
jgi:hypothetical protein